MSRKNKKYSDSRLREIALMSSKGLSAELIAEIKGLPPKSVANICWVYKWSPEKLDEMTERSKLRGPKGDDARTNLRRYFVMHPEQRPAPHLQLFRPEMREAVCQPAAKDLQIDKLKDELAAQRRTLGLLSARVEALENHRQDLSWRVSKQEQNQTALLYNDSANKISAEQFRTLSDKVGELSERVEEIDRSVSSANNLIGAYASRLCVAEKILRQDVIDGNAHSRIDLLARCSGDHNKQLEELKAQVAKMDERSHTLAHCSDEQVLNIHKRLDAMTPQVEALVAQVGHLTRKYDELSTEQIKPVIKVDHRLDAMTSQIERLQDIFMEIAAVLPREFD